jgi:CRP/FNR family cyclic AMP-dependent transcriptional regulator
MTAATLANLREIRFLQELPDALLSQYVTISHIEEFPAGTAIFRQGDPARTIYLVCTGNVSLEICAPGVGCRRILTVAPGELLGWSPVLGQERLTATARTLSATSVVAADGEKLLALCDRNPRFGYEFMKRAAMAIAQRLNATRLQLLDVYGGQMGGAPNVAAEERAGGR